MSGVRFPPPLPFFLSFLTRDIFALVTRSDLKEVVLRALGPSIESTIVAAVSGGPDSMAMFHALCELSRDYAGLRVVAAHFDHQLRSESHRDVDVVSSVADHYGVRVFKFKTDVATRARESGKSIETTARIWRYTFLASVGHQLGSYRLVTAHTRDDQVETVLMRVLRGAHARGLRGIAANDAGKVRPLLDVTHAGTLAYCSANHVPYVLDSTNDDPRYFRNYVRHHVLPSLRSVYPGIDAALLRIRESALVQFDEGERATAGRLNEHLHYENNTWRLSPTAFDGLDEDHRTHLLSCIVERIGLEDVTSVHYRALLSGTDVDLPGCRVRHEHDGMIFSYRADKVKLTPRSIVVPGETYVDEWTFTSARVTGARVCERSGEVAYIPADGALTVRYPREGDRMQPFGMKGHKKLSDLFIDLKIPRRKRVTTPVIEVDGEIVWVVGVATSERCRIHDGARHIIQLTATRSQS